MRLDRPHEQGIIPLLRYDELGRLALLVYGPPEIASDAVDVHEDFVEVPATVGQGAHPINPTLADIRCKQRTKSVLPKPHGLMADLCAALVQ
jgi:hypothetical protein